jgi:hypothetical protein
MELQGAMDYHWNDLPCTARHRFICETLWVYYCYLTAFKNSKLLFQHMNDKIKSMMLKNHHYDELK